jgi:hypothetical protein
VANENDVSVSRGDRALGDRNVVGKRGGRVLDDADLVAVLRQDLVDAFPSGTVNEPAMDKDDRLDRLGNGCGNRNGSDDQ